MVELSDEERGKRLETIAFQTTQYQAGNADAGLQERGRRLIDEIYPQDFNMSLLSLENTLSTAYLYGYAMVKGYRLVKRDLSHDTGETKQMWMSMPKVNLGLAKSELKRFGEIE